MKRKFKTYFFWFFFWLLLVGGAYLACASFFILRNEFYQVAAIFASANLATLFLFAFDKFQAGQKSERVPEIVLFLTVLLGGGIGAIVGMNLFHHKTKKLSFQLVVVSIILLQLISLYFLWSKIACCSLSPVFNKIKNLIN